MPPHDCPFQGEIARMEDVASDVRMVRDKMIQLMGNGNSDGGPAKDSIIGRLIVQGNAHEAIVQRIPWMIVRAALLVGALNFASDHWETGLKWVLSAVAR